MDPNQPIPQPTISPLPIPTPPLPSVDLPGFTQNEEKPVNWKLVGKLVYMAGFLVFFLAGTLYFSRNFFKKATAGKGDILLQTRYQPVLWKDFGEVFEPMIKVPIYYASKGYEEEEFLLDSGAVVSSLPREKAQDMGYSLAKLPRSTFAGFGGTTSFAYKGNLKVMIGDKEVIIPVVFTEAQGTKSILGRAGFFEAYSIYFNSKDEMIEIRE